MPTDLPELTNAPIDVTIGGSAFKLCRPTLAQEAEHELWLQRRYAALAAEACGDDTQKLIAVIDAAGEVSFFSTFAIKSMRSLATVERLLLIGLAKHHPTITLEKLRELSEGKRDDLFTAFNSYCDILFPKPKGKTPPKDEGGNPPPSDGSSTG